jgi:hypothetical protein
MESEMKRRWIFIVVLLVVAGGLSAFASPLNPAQLSRQANWVLHADMDMFKTTTLSAFLRQKSADAGIEEKMDSFKSRFSFHPIDDVHGVTIYGFDTSQDRAVVLIHAEFKTEKIVGLLQEPQMVTYGPHTIYSWNNETCKKKNSREYGAVRGGNLIVMAGSMDAVQKALDVLDGTSENASTGSYLSGYIAEPGQFFYVRADRVCEIAKDDSENVMLKQVEQFLMTAGEINGHFQSRVDMGIPTQEKAVEFEQIIRGLIAFGLMDTQQNTPELTPALKAIQIQSGAGLLSLWMDYKSAELVDVLTKAAGRMTAKGEIASSGEAPQLP